MMIVGVFGSERSLSPHDAFGRCMDMDTGSNSVV